MKHTTGRFAIGAVALAAIGACSDPSAPRDAGTPRDASGTGAVASKCKKAPPDSAIPLPIAPRRARVDLAVPSFSNPTRVTNPLFPISELAQVLLLGNVDGEPLRVETTLLPETRTIDLGGRQVETLVSQYVAYLDGRIHEVALDFYAQADDGAVWYFGEDVFNYENGIIANTEGTWLACRDGPVAMIMPANPQVGDVYRPENIFPLVFEEVTVKSTGVTVDGPQGPVNGAIVVEELHMEGDREDKIFAPGYGEFSTGAGGDLEAVALAVPTDALPGPPPAQLKTLLTGAYAIFDAAQSRKWRRASVTVRDMTTAWNTYQAGSVPPMIRPLMSDALNGLTRAVGARNRAKARQAAVDVAQQALDLQLRHRPRVEIDFARLDLWARQLLVDAAANDTEGVASDVAILEWIWDRVAHVAGSSDVSGIAAQLADLRARADRANLAAVQDAAGRFQLRLRERALYR